MAEGTVCSRCGGDAMIVIVDYGVGNVGSILNMLKRLDVEASVSGKAEEIERADKLILPGVGAFDHGMGSLNASGLRPVLDQQVLERRVPVLGICLGMQLLTRGSEEGKEPGLGWIDGQTVKFRFDAAARLRVPHMGWNVVTPVRKDTLFRDLDADHGFYFVHSYYVTCHSSADVLATTPYGLDFVSSVQKDNVFGAQFHPEKSHKHGMRLLQNFAELP